VNIHEQAGLFGRFHVGWTPTVLVLSPRSVEVWRLEGYLPRGEFGVWLRMGLGRIEFVAKRFVEAQRWYGEVAESSSHFSAEAVYWRAVCKYSATHDPTPLGLVVHELQERFPDSIWALKAQAWQPAGHPSGHAGLP